MLHGNILSSLNTLSGTSKSEKVCDITWSCDKFHLVSQSRVKKLSIIFVIWLFWWKLWFSCFYIFLLLLIKYNNYVEFIFRLWKSFLFTWLVRMTSLLWNSNSMFLSKFHQFSTEAGMQMETRINQQKLNCHCYRGRKIIISKMQLAINIVFPAGMET